MKQGVELMIAGIGDALAASSLSHVTFALAELDYSIHPGGKG
jgi:hypothetical protein